MIWGELVAIVCRCVLIKGLLGLGRRFRSLCAYMKGGRRAKRQRCKLSLRSIYHPVTHVWPQHRRTDERRHSMGARDCQVRAPAQGHRAPRPKPHAQYAISS